jgi:hypothetical protein
MATSTEQDARPARQLPRWVGELVVLGAILTICVALFAALDNGIDLDCDDTNLTLAISRFDIVHFQPHPPGYLGYVAVLKGVHAVTGARPATVVRLVSRLFALLAVLLTWRAALRLWPDERRAALLAAALVAFHPIVLFYGVDAQTHSAELAMTAALLLALAHVLSKPTPGKAVAIGLILAAGGSFRPSYALVSLGPVLWTYRRDWRGLLVIGAVAALGTVAWFVPTILLTTGGLPTYRAASDSLMGNYIRMVSPLSSGAIPRFARDNLTSASTWIALALAPALLALASRRGTWRNSLTAWPLRALLWMALPATLFYAFVLCAEAGYVAGLVAIAALVAAGALARSGGAKPWQAWLGPGLAVAELVFFLLAPSGEGRLIMMPTTTEITARQARMEALYRHLLREVPHERILVVTDWPDPTALRQLPLLRPRLEVLQVPWRLRSDFQPVYSVSLATDHDFVGLFPIPGEPPEFLRRRETTRGYDSIIVDPRTSDRVRDELRAHGRCPVARFEEEAQVRLAPTCFPDHQLRIGDFTFAWGS